MTYADGRRILDADSHVMELGDFLDDYLSAADRALLNRSLFEARRETLDAATAKAAARRSDESAAAEADQRLLRDKGWAAMGGWDPTERSHVLDLLGFDAQLVFGTFGTLLYKTNSELDLYVGTSAHNRAIADFCGADPRLLAVANIPLKDPAKAAAAAEEAIAAGCAAIMVPSTAAGKLAPTHPDLDRFWDTLAQSDTPFVLHVGGGGRGIDPAFHNNGMPVTDHLGGGENIRSKDYLAIYHSPSVFLGALVLDGLFDRFPALRGGCIEQGAAWVVSWLRHLDRAQKSFVRTEEPLSRLTMTPSEYVHRHLKFTPFAGEPVGWMQDECGSDLFMFSSDYPHPEGTTDPLGKFEATLGDASEEDRQKFFAGNFEEMMGSRLAPVTV